MNPASIIEIILNNLMQLMPFRILLSFQLAVRWTMGEKPENLGPGFHWCLWFRHNIEIVSSAEEFFNLPTQSVALPSGEMLCYSCNIGTKVVDAVHYYCDVQDFRESLEALAMTHLAKNVRKANTFAEAVAGLDKLEASLRGRLETKLKRWGVEVTEVGFTDFVHVQTQVRLFGDPKIRSF